MYIRYDKYLLLDASYYLVALPHSNSSVESVFPFPCTFFHTEEEGQVHPLSVCAGWPDSTTHSGVDNNC